MKSTLIKKSKAAKPEPAWVLKLYVAGQTPKSIEAFSNLKKICDEHLEGMYKIVIIDLLKNPQLAKDEQILAVPTLVRMLPRPIRRLIGDMANTDRVLMGLDIKPAAKKSLEKDDADA